MDSICSALAYAHFKQQLGMNHAMAARCGDINDRIEHVLQKFGVAPPRFVADVRPRVRDVMQQKVVQVGMLTSAWEAMEIMDRTNIRSLPIVDEALRCCGLVSVFKMSKFFLPAQARLADTRRILCSLDQLADTLKCDDAEMVNSQVEEELTLMIGAMSAESFESRLSHYDTSKLLLVVGDREDIQEAAIASKVRVLVVTGNLQVSDPIRAKARANGVSIIRSAHDSTTTAMLCRAAIPVRHLRTEHFLHFNEDEPLAQIRNLAVSSQFQAFPVQDAHGRLVGILSKTDFIKPVNRQLILVDHNELSQAVEGADQVEIIEIVDHHRIGAMTTQKPILFVNRPVGSTCTIVTEMFLQHQVKLPRDIAGLLLAGIISDTLNLTSPTATDLDAEMLKTLETITGIKATSFTEEIFSSGSVLKQRLPEKAIVNDCKIYHEKGHTFSVAQIEEIGFQEFWDQHERLSLALESYQKQGSHTFSALLITDVVRQGSLLLVVGEQKLVDLIEYKQRRLGVYDLPGIVSRKKQLLPYLTKCLMAAENL
jgi:manganese-dependent inorganic pyrophosphatase